MPSFPFGIGYKKGVGTLWPTPFRLPYRAADALFLLNFPGGLTHSRCRAPLLRFPCSPPPLPFSSVSHRKTLCIGLGDGKAFPEHYLLCLLRRFF